MAPFSPTVSPSLTEAGDLNTAKGFRIVLMLAEADIALDLETGAMLIKMQLVSLASKNHY